MTIMIENYEIRDVNKEKILVLYLSFDYEFSSDLKHNNIIMKITNFINDKKIKWNGTKIILVVGGLVLGSVVLNNTYVKKEDNKHYTYVSNVILNHFDNFDNEIGYSKIEIKEPTIIITESEKQIENKPNIDNNKSPSSSTSNKKEEQLKTNNQEQNKEPL